MKAIDLIIPRTFLAAQPSPYFFLLSDRCETKASFLSLFYFLSRGDVNRSAALLYKLTENLLPTGAFPDYLNHNDLKNQLGPQDVSASRLTQVWALYGISTFILSLGIEDQLSARYNLFLKSRLDALADELVASNVLRELDGRALLETQSVAYFVFSLAPKIYGDDYSAAKQSCLNAVNAFWNLSGYFESVMGPDSRFSFDAPNAESQLYGALVLDREGDVRLTDVFRQIDFEFRTMANDFSGISFSPLGSGHVRYDLTSLFILLLQNMGRTASAEMLYGKVADLFSRSGGLPHANYDGGKEMKISSDLHSVAYPVPSVYSMAFLELAIHETSALFRNDVPSIYSFAIFDTDAVGDYAGELLLEGDVNSAPNNQHKIVQDA